MDWHTYSTPISTIFKEFLLEELPQPLALVYNAKSRNGLICHNLPKSWTSALQEFEQKWILHGNKVICISTFTSKTDHRNIPSLRQEKTVKITKSKHQPIPSTNHISTVLVHWRTHKSFPGWNPQRTNASWKRSVIETRNWTFTAGERVTFQQSAACFIDLPGSNYWTYSRRLKLIIKTHC